MKFSSFIKKITSGIPLSTGLMISLIFIYGEVFVSCTDNDLELPGQENNSDGETSYKLSFRVALDNGQETRDEGEMVSVGDEFDTKVDTEGKFQVFFFDSNGNFLFEATNKEVKKTPDDNGQWNVTINLDSSLHDNEGKSILTLIRNRLEKESFKISVLANWPERVDWGWAQSHLNTSSTDKKNINDLHHIKQDNIYTKGKESESNKYSAKDVYKFLLEDNDDKMGMKVDWVESTIDWKVEDPDDYIRTNWDPETTYTDEEFFYRYKRMWQVWNFGGSYPNNALTYDKLARPKDDDGSTFLANELGDTWNKRSGITFYDWLGNPTSDASNKELKEDKENIDGFWFDAYYDGKVKKINGIVSYAYHNGNYHGIALGRTNDTDKDTDNNDIIKHSSDYEAGYIKISAPATGKLRILWSSAKKGTKAKFKVQRSTNFLGEPSEYDGTDPIQYYKDISITGNEEDIYIFNNRDAHVVIYAIEYICDKYLYETDRKGIAQLIPMYGTQNFDALTQWGSVEEINLSEKGKYIDLIRSVAKVELYLPRNNDETFYVGMRSMNRTSRCEPMDVETPTYKAWARMTDGTSVHDALHCEWFDLCSYGAGYGRPSGSITDYQNWLSWFYGSWKNAKWKNNSDGSTGWTFNGVTVPDKDFYPHIFNPSINRSDYCEFIYAGYDDISGLYRYYLYVPDKFIDDPNEVGDLTSTPKVMHIEYRYEHGNNVEEHLDDNNCHRVYFADYTTDIRNKNNNEFDAYELEGLNDGVFWPVMRNHVYRFYVNSSAQKQEVYVTVNDFTHHSKIKQENW